MCWIYECKFFLVPISEINLFTLKVDWAVSFPKKKKKKERFVLGLGDFKVKPNVEKILDDDAIDLGLKYNYLGKSLRQPPKFFFSSFSLLGV